MNLTNLDTAMMQAFHAAGYTGKGACIHVPGTMAANGYDDYPHDMYMVQVIQKWCPDAVIRPIDVFEDGETVWRIKQAMRDIAAYAIAHPEYMHFVNMSFVWDGYDEDAHTLLKVLLGNNVTVFAAAGNDGKENLRYYPSHYEEPICIAALDNDGTKADFSTWHDEMDFAELGVDAPCVDKMGKEVLISGTSIATPICLAKAVLLAEQYKDRHGAKPTEPQIYQMMFNAAQDLGAAGYDSYTGYGFVNIKLEEGVPMFIPIKNGDKGERVLELQKILNTLKYDTGGLDSDFGSKTEASVISYQTMKGLPTTGIVDEATWNALLVEKHEPAFEPTGLMRAFIQYLNEQAANHGIYVWGAQGQTGKEISESWIRSRETSSAKADRAIAFWKKQVAAGYGDVLRAFDCSGLGMYFIENLYHLKKSDASANGMYGMCIPVTRSNLRAGDWVFRDTDGDSDQEHIGYVVDNDLNVIHDRGRDFGVVRESLNHNGTGYWNGYGRPTIFESVSEPPVETKRNLKLTTPCMRGDDVKALQTVLQYLGYDIGSAGADGIYGKDTDDALKLLQDRATKLTAGVCDAAMCALLGL